MTAIEYDETNVALCAGYGGLDLAVESALQVRTAAVSEVDAGACRILEHRYPGVPNLGDMTTVDWAGLVGPGRPLRARPRVVSGGTPCQDLSHAGRRAGMTEGTRSNLWVAMREAVAQLRPTYVVWENVRGAYSAEADSALEYCPGCMGDRRPGVVLRALGRVLGDLADLGYDAQWRGLRAADVGAPHGRFRVFVLAVDRSAAAADVSGERGEEGGRGTVRRASPGGRPSGVADERDPRPVADAEGGVLGAGLRSSEPGRLGGRRLGDDGRAGSVADSDDAGRGEHGGALDVREELDPAERPRDAVPDTSSDGRVQGGTESAGQLGGSDAALGGRADAPDADDLGREGVAPGDRQDGGVDLEPGDDAHGRGTVDWGAYGPAVERWEHVLGRRAPEPTRPGPKGGERLNPEFVEWMMGLPAGWVTEVPGLTRNQMLHALGNGVVSQQAEAAVLDMLRSA